MRVTHYSFGNITIDGKRYVDDVIVYPDRVHAPWWRIEGHVLHPEDLSEVINEKPAVLIVGTGHSGAMGVPQETLRLLQSKGIVVRIAKTDKAVELFNQASKQLGNDKSVVAALHLTC
jgi:hypothetical protein